MAFREYKSVGTVLRDYPMVVRTERFLCGRRSELPPYLDFNLRFAEDQRAPEEAESYYSEAFIYPLLQAVWQNHLRPHVWTRRPIAANDRLCGEPDYLVAAQSEVSGHTLIQRPLLAIVEAKRQDFDEGWGQCLAAMVACRLLNGAEPFVLYGIVSTGYLWEFGRLDGERFVRHPDAIALSDTASVYGTLDEVFALCERQLPP